jgi:1-acyl-sn-glycerol-3-phosphate acyltransferase
MLLFATNRKPFYMTRADLLTIPVLGAALKYLGCIGVEKGAAADRAVLRLAQEVLEAGQVLVVFPEGGLRKGMGVGPISDGVAFLAMRTGATVVPVGMYGTDKVLPIKSKIPRPHRVRVVIGHPIHSAREVGRVPRGRVAAKSEEVRSAMERAYAYAGEAKSVWPAQSGKHRRGHGRD